MKITLINASKDKQYKSYVNKYILYMKQAINAETVERIQAEKFDVNNIPCKPDMIVITHVKPNTFSMEDLMKITKTAPTKHIILLMHELYLLNAVWNMIAYTSNICHTVNHNEQINIDNLNSLIETYDIANDITDMVPCLLSVTNWDVWVGKSYKNKYQSVIAIEGIEKEDINSCAEDIAEEWTNIHNVISQKQLYEAGRKLEHCPCCTAKTSMKHIELNNTNKFYAECNECHCRTDYYNDFDSVITTWNTRKEIENIRKSLQMTLDHFGITQDQILDYLKG